MQHIPEGFVPSEFDDGFMGAIGPFYVKHTDAGVVIGMRIGEAHMNKTDVVHGGMMATLADVSLAQQIYFSENPRLLLVTTSLTTNFLAAAKMGDWLEGHSRIDRKGKRTAYASGEIRRGDEILATMSGLFSLMR